MRRILPAIHGRGQLVSADPAVAERRNPMRVKRDELRVAKNAFFENPPDFAAMVERRVEGFAELQQLRRTRL